MEFIPDGLYQTTHSGRDHQPVLEQKSGQNDGQTDESHSENNKRSRRVILQLGDERHTFEIFWMDGHHTVSNVRGVSLVAHQMSRIDHGQDGSLHPLVGVDHHAVALEGVARQVDLDVSGLVQALQSLVSEVLDEIGTHV